MADALDFPHERLGWARRRAGYTSKAAFADAMKVPPVTYRAYENGQNGFSKLAPAFGRKLGVSAEWLLEGGPLPTTDAPQSTEPVDETPMVGIAHIDMAYGMGITFAVDHPEVEVLMFPKQWVETITHSPAEMLTWTRGRGDSMEPTIHDGDLVLIDRSDRSVKEPDKLWAFTVGDQAAIKRLRRKGSVYEIHSDNQSVRPDKEPADAVHIVGRVVFVGARK